MNWIEGQPIFFANDVSPECCESTWRNIVFPQDVISWQFNVPPCFTERPATDNCNFTTNTDWTLGDVDYTGNDSVRFNNINAGINQICLTPGVWYRLELDILFIQGGYAMDIIGFEDVITIDQPGIYEFFVKATSSVIAANITQGTDPIISPVLGACILRQFCATQAIEPTVEAFNEDGSSIGVVGITQIRNGQFVTFSADLDLIEPESCGDCIYFQVSLDCGEDFVDTWTSELLKFKPVDSCHLQIGICADVSRFDFDFFNPVVRLYSLFRPTTPNYESEIFRDTSGRTKILYQDKQKIWELRTGEAPEHVVDFLAMIPNAQSVLIRKRYETSKNYVTFESEFDLQYIQGDDYLARCTIALTEQENPVTSYATSVDCRVLVPPVVLGTEVPNQALMTESNELIEIE